ncbi:hypothetical protein NIES2101_42485 [Calothrix sp. HK-06]|nr:hypothetical protein NIES2101_42485 [Calothrix sp. HK-06]
MQQQLSGLNFDIVIPTSKPATSTIAATFLDAANITSGMELASEPISTPGYARTEYRKPLNGSIILTAEQTRVGFSETFSSDGEAPAIIRMSRSYTQMLPNLG